MENGKVERGGDGVRSFFMGAAAALAVAVLVFLRFGRGIIVGCRNGKDDGTAGMEGSDLMSSDGSGGMYGGGGEGLELRHNCRKSEGLIELGMNAGHVMREGSGVDSRALYSSRSWLWSRWSLLGLGI